MEFAGFPVAALDFYDDLEMDNTRTFWEAHKATYDDAVKAPLQALCAALAPEFGPAKIFRPHRDVRFAKDKSPYKTHQGAYVAVAPSTGWYLQIAAQGFMTAGGFYGADSAGLAAYRAAVDNDRRGAALQRILDELTGTGWVVGGERVKTAPRGYDIAHPRIELLRHKALTVSRQHGFAPVIHTSALLDVVRQDWRAVRPLNEWLADQLGPHANG